MVHPPNAMLFSLKKEGNQQSSGEGKMRSYCLVGIEFQFCKMKRVLEMDGGDVCTVM